MAQLETDQSQSQLSVGRIVTLGASLVLLVPFITLALMPMVLFLVPVAIVGLPFLLPAFLTGTLAARNESKRFTPLRPHLSIVRVAR